MNTPSSPPGSAPNNPPFTMLDLLAELAGGDKRLLEPIQLARWLLTAMPPRELALVARTMDLGEPDTNTHAALLVAGHALARAGGKEGAVALFSRWAPGHAAELRQAMGISKTSGSTP